LVVLERLHKVVVGSGVQPGPLETDPQTEGVRDVKPQAEAAFDCPANAGNAGRSGAELRSPVRRSVTCAHGDLLCGLPARSVIAQGWAARTLGRSPKRAFASRLRMIRPVSAACAAMIRSCAPRGVPARRACAMSRAW